jgi:hypothetical protein
MSRNVYTKPLIYLLSFLLLLLTFGGLGAGMAIYFSDRPWETAKTLLFIAIFVIPFSVILVAFIALTKARDDEA